MEKQWIGCAAANFREGRQAGLKPELIVLHTLDGTLRESGARFHRPDTALSVHYGIGTMGDVHQYVAETDTAFHAGLVINPVARLVRERPKINPNFYTIGISLEGNAGQAWTEAQVTTAAGLLLEISARWNIPLDVDHVVSHTAIRASVDCPGSHADINRLLELAAANRDRVSERTTVRLLSSVNLRLRPSIDAPIVRVLSSGIPVDVEGFVQGDSVSGNSFWYQDSAGNCFWAGATDCPNPLAPASPDTEATTDNMVIAPPPQPASGPSINRNSFRLSAGQFLPERTKKDLIVLHFTAGRTARSAFDTWSRDTERVATAYLVDLDGTIHEVFDPERWAFHLGIKGTNGRHDRRSIGIEIANVGPLRKSKKDPNTLNWWFADFGTKFCTVDERELYVAESYRSIDHFAAFPKPQVAAVSLLTANLCERFSIPKRLPPMDRRYECDAAFFNTYTGVATHANYRLDKWDIGPAFDWPALGI